MKRKIKLSFGERMREWRKARKEYAEKVKQKISQKASIEGDYPRLAVPAENKTISLSPLQNVKSEMPIQNISKPANHIEAAIEHLREKIKGL